MSGSHLTHRAGPATDSASSIYRHILARDGLIEYFEPGFTTVYAHMTKTFQQLGGRPSIGSREELGSDKYGAYKWKTWADVDKITSELASGIRALGLARQVADELTSIECLGICGKNQEGWVLTEVACFRQDITIVPLYDTLGEEGMQTILTETQILTVFTHSSNFQTLLKYVTRYGSVRNLVFFDVPTEEHKTKAAEHNLTLYSFAEVQENGRRQLVEDRPPAPESALLICYTSGTTGAPKGAIITHKNLVSSAAAISAAAVTFAPKDIYLSFLPLSHIYEQLALCTWVVSGYSIGFYTGNPARIMEDAQELKPTFMCSVPRMIMRMYDGIQDKVSKSGFITRLIVNLSISVKLRLLKHYHTNYLLDKLVFSKFRASLGGRCRIMSTGSAPIKAEVLNYLRVCFSMPIPEGYGQTESSSYISSDTEFGLASGTVGRISPAIELKLVDHPELNYSHTNPLESGEIVYRGHSGMKGYFKHPELTNKTIDAEGWIYTGDIGLLTPDGNLKIIDRVKNLFKMSQGEYIAPEKLEIAYGVSHFISNIFITAESTKDYAVAIIVPHFSLLREKLGALTDEELAGSAGAKKLIYEDIKRIAAESKFNPLEIPRAIFLDTTAFEANDLLTPTLKTKRPIASRFYARQVQALYLEPRFN